ncbi:UreD urease accessory protein-domain-containing protein [Lasiosphaeria miniovina]|uniref:UreD urease accessory protein-domain-containing protein n=1 Tax=Lasiosphaeria miniovina TaxID=1954250 RepID=A0AA40EA84_9PEZI|nr:UreD urease accessory protein-domain-containing protein [Lasiosphaeria miniovina]KAK0728058.1 UreD urease accessory protein-domain-containing protein [Lasiosphaeria miniovina]
MESPFPKSSSAPGEGRVVAKLQPEGGSALEALAYQYPLKLISPSRPAHSTKSVLVFLLSYGGGLVGGDSVSLAVDMRPGARLSMVTQGHTKVFAPATATPNLVTRQTMRAHLAPAAALCLLPDPVQPFAASVYEQTQVFRLAPDASLCLLDWVTQGRSARGEDWSFARWTGRNEVWAVTENYHRLLVRDAVILDGAQPSPPHIMPTLRESMHAMGVVGTLILRGPLVKALADFFLAEFAALPRLGSRDFRTDADARRDAAAESVSDLEKWRRTRLLTERSTRLLWSAANVRGCVVVKFGAPTVEAGRLWVGAMLAREGSVARVFGDHALMCVR